MQRERERGGGDTDRDSEGENEQTETAFMVENIERQTDTGKGTERQEGGGGVCVLYVCISEGKRQR